MALMDLCGPLDQSDRYHLSYRLGRLHQCVPLAQSARYRLSYRLVLMALCAQAVKSMLAL